MHHLRQHDLHLHPSHVLANTAPSARGESAVSALRKRHFLRAAAFGVFFERQPALRAEDEGVRVHGGVEAEGVQTCAQLCAGREEVAFYGGAAFTHRASQLRGHGRRDAQRFVDESFHVLALVQLHVALDVGRVGVSGEDLAGELLLNARVARQVEGHGGGDGGGGVAAGDGQDFALAVQLVQVVAQLAGLRVFRAEKVVEEVFALGPHAFLHFFFDFGAVFEVLHDEGLPLFQARGDGVFEQEVEAAGFEPEPEVGVGGEDDLVGWLERLMEGDWDCEQ